jgi:hypothetical protein
MEIINVQHQETTTTGWTFLVEVEGIEYTVTLDERYYIELTNQQIEPAELIERAFAFLLKREPKEAILRKFNVNVIKEYFREFEDEMKGQQTSINTIIEDEINFLDVE